MYVGKSNDILVRVNKMDLTHFSEKFLQNIEHKRMSLRPSNETLYKVNIVWLKKTTLYFWSKNQNNNNNFIKVTKDKKQKKGQNYNERTRIVTLEVYNILLFLDKLLVKVTYFNAKEKL